MNKVVDQLLEIDRQARQTLDEAQQYYDNTMEEIAREKERLSVTYQERAHQRIAQLKEAESQRMDEEVARITAHCEVLARQMEERYEQEHKAWEEELYRRCIG